MSLCNNDLVQLYHLPQGPHDPLAPVPGPPTLPRMDDLQQPPPDLPPLPGAPAPPRAQGRPPADPGARAASDRRYAALLEMESILPAKAKDARFAVFRARANDTKAATRPAMRILTTTWRDMGLDDPGALASYLQEKLGPGRYLIEPQDAHNQRLTKLPAWIQATDEESEGGVMVEEEDEPGMPTLRRGWAHRPSEDEGEDPEDLTPQERSTNAMDFLTTSVRLQNEQTKENAMQAQSMLQSMLVLNQQAEDRRREAEAERRKEEADARRREDERREERRREERLAEEHRREEDRKRDEERREERKLDIQRQIEASNKRLELVMGAVSALVPVIAKVLDRKEDPMQSAILAFLTKDKTADPTQIMLLKHILDKSQSGDHLTTMVQSMGEMSKMSSSMMAEQMKSMFLTMNQFQQEAMKKVMAMALANPHIDEEEKSTFQQVMEAISGASSLITGLTGGQQAPPQPQPLPMPQPQQMLQPLPVPLPAPQQEQPPPLPMGIAGVGACLMTIQQKQYPDQATYQKVVEMLIDNMPDDLRQAVVDGDEAKIVEQCVPVFQQEPELKAWVMQPDMFDWIRSFLSDLVPMLQSSEQEQEQEAEDPEAP